MLDLWSVCTSSSMIVVFLQIQILTCAASVVDTPCTCVLNHCAASDPDKIIRLIIEGETLLAIPLNIRSPLCNSCHHFES